MERTGATYSFLVPTMIAMALDEAGAQDLASPGCGGCAGAPRRSPPSVAARAQRVFGRVLAQTYGQSEAPMAITVLQPDEHDRVGSAGRPYTLMEVAAVDDDDCRCRPVEVGEIVIGGRS